MHQFVVNPSTGDNNQCTTDMQNLFKNLLENVNMTQNVPVQENNPYLFANKMPGPYIIQIPYNSFNSPAQYVMNLPNGQQVYVNQPIAFQQNEAGIQYNVPQVMPVATNFFQVDVNDLNKNNNNQNMSINMRSRKKSYNQVKPESEVQVDQNSEQLYDTKNRPLLYSCSECSRKFSMQSRLTQHKKCHSNTRPFQCKACGFAFTQKSYLVRHAAVHKEERPYECSLCKKTYKHYGSLANHRKTHKNGSKNLEGHSDNENPVVIGTSSVNLKIENQSLDVNNNPSTDSYEHNNNAEFMFQSQTDPSQTYHSQYNSNNQAAHFSNSFPNILSTNNGTEPNSGFLNHLNNFYPIISNSVSLDNLKIEKNPSDNNSSINGDFQSQTVKNRLSPTSTFTI